jgi:activator of 2-hydroxyglutaryl-CoA dehydratase
MSNSLLNIFKGFLSAKEESVIGIDIGSASIKVVQLKRKKGKCYHVVIMLLIHSTDYKYITVATSVLGMVQLM